MIKKIFLSIIAAVLIFIVVMTISGRQAISYNGGAPAGYTGSPGDGNNCTGCHLGSASVSPGIISSNVPVSGYVGGTTYSFTITLPGVGNKGFEVSPQDATGSLIGTLISGTGSKLVGSGKYITHSTYSSSNPASWTFQWKAPVAGTGDVTFYGAFAVSKASTILSTLTITDASITGPTLMANPDTLTGFSYYFGSGPSSIKSFSLVGNQLTGFPGNISVSAPSDYEISLDNSTYSAACNITYTSSSLTSTTVFVRLKAGLSAGNYNAELITVSGGGATSIHVDCDGSVSSAAAPSLLVSPSTLTGFTYIINSGPSSSQTYNISGSNLTGYPDEITVTAQNYFEVSTDNSTFTPAVNISYTSSTLLSTPVYVRLKAGLGVGSYNSETISNTGGGASNAFVICSGNVTAAPSAMLSANVSTLTGFSYITGTGPSVSQSYDLSGTNLEGFPGNIVVTAPADYEVSADNSIFSTSTTVPFTSSTLSSTPVYVRLKAGLATASYNSEKIINAGGGADTLKVTCSGSVTDASTSCDNETFTGIPTSSSSSYSSRTWTGDDGNTWNATTARTDQTITGKAICFKGYVESSVSPNGIGDLTVTTKFPFADGTYNIPVYVNNVQVGTVPVSTTLATTTLTGINISGSVQIKLASDGTKRPCIDDLSWSCYSAVTGLSDMQKASSGLLIYPNPADDQVICALSLSEETSISLAISNFLGQIVLSKDLLSEKGTMNIPLDISSLPGGVYSVIVRSSDGKIMESRPLVIR
jgi:hypothetical protein